MIRVVELLLQKGANVFIKKVRLPLISALCTWYTYNIHI